MNRLSEYITGMTLTRQHLNDARAKSEKGLDSLAVRALIDAFAAFASATTCAVSIREGKKPKAKARP